MEGILATNKESERLIFSILKPSPAFSWISTSVFPSVNPSASTYKAASNILVSFFGERGGSFGNNRGPTNHKNNMPNEPAMTAGRTKSNN